MSRSKSATPKGRVLARYPGAKCIRHRYWPFWVVVNTLNHNEWADTPQQAWADAGTRLRRTR